MLAESKSFEQDPPTCPSGDPSTPEIFQPREYSIPINVLTSRSGFRVGFRMNASEKDDVDNSGCNRHTVRRYLHEVGNFSVYGEGLTKATLSINEYNIPFRQINPGEWVCISHESSWIPLWFMPYTFAEVSIEGTGLANLWYHTRDVCQDEYRKCTERFIDRDWEGENWTIGNGCVCKTMYFTPAHRNT
jgi:hypothetical protein